MGTQNIQNFIHELADYINNFIVGTENTVITRCEVMDQMTNRGHAIPVRVKDPGISGNTADLAPVFYAEELMEANKGRTIAVIGETLNVEVNGFYKDMVNLMKAQEESYAKTFSDYNMSDIIAAAVPEGYAESTDIKGKPLVKKEQYGLVITMKAEIYTAHLKDGDQGYFTPIIADPSGMPTEEQWEQAQKNALARSEIQMMVIPVTEEEKAIPVCGEICDAREFFDYFYLQAVKLVWGSLLRDLKAERVYIFPCGPYNAKFVLWGGEIENSDTANALRTAFMQDAVKSIYGVQRVFIMDNTLEVREVK